MKTKKDTDNGIMARLKRETLGQHQQTEEGVDLMREDFSMDDYRNLLVRFYAFYKPFEEKMQAAVRKNSLAIDYDERLNLPKLRRDLAFLGFGDADRRRLFCCAISIYRPDLCPNIRSRVF